MIEQVPDGDGVARIILKPRMYDAHNNSLIWDVVFQFPGGRCESAVWRKYAATDDAVHQVGHEVEETIKLRRSNTLYIGFISANVGEIRSVETARGHGFSVVHDPSEDQGLHHVHICYRPQGDQDPTDLTRNDKNELKLLLRNVFDVEMTTR